MTKTRDRVAGHVLEVHHEQQGAVVATAGAIGAAYLEVDDVTDFEEDGGQAEHESSSGTRTVYTYSGIDEDLNRILLSGTLSVASAVNDPVRVYPHTREKIAVVAVDDVEAEEPVHAIIRHALRPLLPTGVRQGRLVDSEAVELELVDDEWQAAELSGQDTATVDPGDLALTDQTAPGSSPTPTVIGGVGFLAVRWNRVTNPDAVTYEVHVSTTSGFTPDSSPGSATLYAETNGTVAIVKNLPLGGALSYGTTYYVKLVAKDADGPAGASAQGSGSMVQASGPDLAVGSIIAGSGIIAALAVGNAQIADLDVGKLTAGTLIADVTIAGTIKTAATGKRVVIDSSGIKLKKPNPPGADLTTAFFDTATGDVTIIGTFSTAFTGNRIEIDSGTDQDSIKFIASDGTFFKIASQKGAFPSGGASRNIAEVRSGDIKWSATKNARLMQEGVVIMEALTAAQVLGGGQIGIDQAMLYVDRTSAGRPRLSVRFGSASGADHGTFVLATASS